MDFVSAHILAKQLEMQNDTNLEIAKVQAESVDKQIAAQQEANKEQQEYNKAEAELAFKRNSSKGQLQQLMDAGLSAQQARQIIAGGSAGAYTAAPSVNQMSGVDYTAQGAAQGAILGAESAVAQTPLSQAALIWDNSIFGKSLSAFESGLPNMALQLTEGAIQSSMSSSDGGLIGMYAAQPLVGEVMSHLSELSPEQRGSYASFCSLASSAAAPAWMKTADFQNVMSSMNKNPYAVKYLKSFFNTSNELLTGDTAMEGKLLDVQMKAAQAKIASFKVDQESIATDIARVESDYQIAILPDRYAAMLTTYQSEVAEMAANRDLWQNDAYKRAYIKEKLKSTEDAALIAEIMTLQHNGAFQHLQDHPEMQQMFGIYQMWNDVGMTDEWFGQLVASIDAAGSATLGFGVADILSGIHNWVTNRQNNSGHGLFRRQP